MKVTVMRRLQGNGKVFYVSNEKDHKGRYGQYTQKEVEGNPAKFQIQESGSIALPKALKELNAVVAVLPQKPVDEKHRELAEQWKERGLTPEAAAVAAKVQTKMAPPASDIEFWSKFKW